MKQVICANPRIIVNPLLPELLCTYKNYVLNGHALRFRGRFSDYDFPYHLFSVKQHVWSESCLDDCYIINPKTGETIPIYLKVNCGKCPACEHEKQNSYVQRCQLETQCYDSKPWFVTLTYDNQHLHLVEHNGNYFPTLSVRDVQLFMKRLRVNLERKGIQTEKIRYSCVGEYGKNTHRPHYHMIIWNIQAFDNVTRLKVSHIIRDSWKNGYILTRLINPEDDNGRSFRYTSKYLHKHHYNYFPDEVYELDDFKNVFHCSSRGNGGIGSHFLYKYKNDILHKGAMFFNKFTQKPENLFFTRYVLDKLCPSYSKLVPSFYRNACKELLYYNRGEHTEFLNLLRREYPCFISKIPPSELPNLHYHSAEECIEVIFRWRSNPRYVLPDVARYKQVEREGLLLKLFGDIPEKDISAYVHKSRQILNRQFALEQL